MIVAAIKPGDHAKRIVSEAERLADAFDESVHVLHVMEQSEFVARERESAEETGRPVEMDEIRGIAADRGRAVADTVGLSVRHEAIGLVGSPAKEIVRYVSKHDANYLLIGTGKRSPAGKALFGSVAQSVLLNTEGPVVVIGR